MHGCDVAFEIVLAVRNIPTLRAAEQLLAPGVLPHCSEIQKGGRLGDRVAQVLGSGGWEGCFVPMGPDVLERVVGGLGVLQPHRQRNGDGEGWVGTGG